MKVVVPSVHYADFLAVTLPAWRALLPSNAKLTVVTSPADTDTQAVAKGSAGVALCVTDLWTLEGRTFNKGGALDRAFGFTPGWTEPPSKREACLSIDADVYPFGACPDRSLLRTGILYGCPRYHAATPTQLNAHIAGKTSVEALAVIQTRQRGQDAPRLEATGAHDVARNCLGYFQLFRYAAGISFGHSKTAGKYDMDFRQHFYRRRAVSGIYVVHLGAMSRRNWRGRVVPKWEPVST